MMLPLECISYRTGFSLRAAAILLINEIHEITFSWSMISPILCLWKAYIKISVTSKDIKF